MEIKNNKVLFLIFSFVVILFSLFFSLKMGATMHNTSEVLDALTGKDNSVNSILILDLRLPRFIFSCLVGIALSVSGVALQGLFRNPLTEPSIIGVSSGAACFAAFVIIFSDLLPVWLINQFSDYLLPVAAFIGGVSTTFLAYNISNYKKTASVASLLLTGLAITAFFFGLIGFLTYIANDQQLRSVTFWNLGSLAGATWNIVWISTLPVLLSAWFILRSSKQLDALSLGEENAESLGIDVKKLSRKIIVLAALSVGIVTAFCGIISFVGIIVPHLARLLFGPSHRFLLISSILLGVIFMSVTDVFARTIFLPSELPINIITSLFGAPVFMFLLLKNRQKGLIYD